MPKESSLGASRTFDFSADLGQLTVGPVPRTPPPSPTHSLTGGLTTWRIRNERLRIMLAPVRRKDDYAHIYKEKGYIYCYPGYWLLWLYWLLTSDFLPLSFVSFFQSEFKTGAVWCLLIQISVIDSGFSLCRGIDLAATWLCFRFSVYHFFLFFFLHYFFCPLWRGHYAYALWDERICELWWLHPGDRIIVTKTEAIRKGNLCLLKKKKRKYILTLSAFVFKKAFKHLNFKSI